MTTLIKGGNGFVPSVPLRIAVRGRGMDAMALLLTERGLVRGDADVVFHGQPAHPNGVVRFARAEDGGDWLEVGLPALEPDVDRVLVVGSTDRGALRDVPGLSVEAFAPDGTPVARYDVTDAAGETAMVLAELYRRAGGWKFRAVGQGWANGLEGLATDHGVHVAGAEPRTAPAPHTPPPAVATPAPAFAPPPAPPAFGPGVPVPAPAPAPAPGFAPPPAAYAPPGVVPGTVPAPLPAPAPYPAPAPHGAAQAPAAPVPPALDDAWTYGPVFAPYVETGRDNDVLTVEGLPPGPVIVQLEVPNAGYTCLDVLDKRNKDTDNLISSTEDHYVGRVLATVPTSGTLRLRLEAEGPWRFEVAPLASARRLTEREAEFRGPDVLLHTLGVADLAIHYRGDSNLIVNVFELAGHEDPTVLPDDDYLISEIGPRRERAPLPEGPLVVQFEYADGPWTARLERVQPRTGPLFPGAAPASPWQAPAPAADRKGWFPRR
ncbi:MULTISPECIES: TerD family protein [Streptomyces]|uniref:TerD family protein n=2 Tax=Streptomyces TaxID=1883 RepID=A0ABU4KE14_9ACTN|nr:TerD family protein [Streptomyces roseolus]MDX2296013.1 TerD family protein [Streptomyces roseolus]